MLYLLEQLPLGLVTQIKVIPKRWHNRNGVLALVHSDLLGVFSVQLNIQDADRLLTSESALVLIVETDFSWVHPNRWVWQFLLSGRATFRPKWLVERHLIRDQGLWWDSAGCSRHSCPVLWMQERCLLILVSLPCSHVARSRLNIFINGSWIRLLLVLVPLRIQWKWALWVLNLLHIHLVEWFLWDTMPELLWFLLIVLPFDSRSIHDSRVVNPTTSPWSWPWASSWIRPIALPWSTVCLWLKGAIFFLSLIL